MKYVALMSVAPLGSITWPDSNTGIKFFRSPISDSKNEVEIWLEERKKEFPNCCINTMVENKDYYIHTCIIAYSEDESSNVRQFLGFSFIP